MSSGFGRGPIPGFASATDDELTPERTRLKLLTGPQAGREYALKGLKTVVGRNDPPQVMVDIDLTELELGETPVVSRRHAEFTWAAGELLLTDLGSTNGTQLNGEPLKGETPRQPSPQAVIKAGDRIVFANLEFEVVTGR